MLVRLGMHEACYQFYVGMYADGSWADYGVVWSSGWYSVEVWLTQ